MMATENVGAVIKTLHARIDGIATALLMRNGQVVYAEVPSGVYTESFGIMCATMFGAAVTAYAELHWPPPERIVIEGADGTTILVGRGEKTLLVAVVDRTGDRTQILEEVDRVVACLPL